MNQPGTDALTPPLAFAVPGRLIEQGYDAGQRRLTVRFEARGGEGPVVLSVPEHAAGDGFAVRIDGRAAEARLDERTRRLVVAWSGAAGSHELLVDLE
ncbi:MAG: hypothetical protein IPK07_25620 [Deltaproteobacteria bacterium]|nr:hypothetical protein [Deltaproteobacteria bacterium]